MVGENRDIPKVRGKLGCDPCVPGDPEARRHYIGGPHCRRCTGHAHRQQRSILGYLEGTPQARGIEARREHWTKSWLGNPAIKAVFLRLLAENGGNPKRPTSDVPAW